MQKLIQFAPRLKCSKLTSITFLKETYMYICLWTGNGFQDITLTSQATKEKNG